MFSEITSIFVIILGLYAILNLFLRNKRPLHIKKDVKINNKYYKYYYLPTYISLVVFGFASWIYGPDKYLILNPLYFYSLITFNLMQIIGMLFIDYKYTSK